MKINFVRTFITDHEAEELKPVVMIVVGTMRSRVFISHKRDERKIWIEVRDVRALQKLEEFFEEKMGLISEETKVLRAVVVRAVVEPGAPA